MYRTAYRYVYEGVLSFVTPRRLCRPSILLVAWLFSVGR
jgi:hypothetical protein